MRPPTKPAEITHRILFAVLIGAWLIFSINACTVKARIIEPGTIPKIDALAPGEEAFGKRLFEDLGDDYKLETSSKRLEGLVAIFDKLIQAAEVDHLPWNIYLFEDPETVDIRAVHGNYIFVWSGFLEAAENDDEIAALMSCEIGHVLARHTYPVEFTLATNIFFDVAEIATSVAMTMASQGAVMIGGRGWMKWAYVELSDLDALDRQYSAEEEREATQIAMLLMERAQYSPEALLTFWHRVENDEALTKRATSLKRDFPSKVRIQIIKDLLPQAPPENVTLIPENIQTSHRDFNSIKGIIQ